MLFGCLAVLALIGLALLGRGVTPVEADGPAVLTPVRWAAANLSRQARAETVRLQRDAGELRAFLAGPGPALIRCGRCCWRSGSMPGTARARRRRPGRCRRDLHCTNRRCSAGVDAAATIARYASGAVPRDQAVTALNDALARIKVLAGPATPAPEGGAARQVQVSWPMAIPTRRRPDLGAAPRCGAGAAALAEGHVREYAGVLERLPHSLAADRDRHSQARRSGLLQAA